VSDRPLPNPSCSRQAVKRLRRRRKRLARCLLDEAYAEYLRDLAPQNNNNHSNFSISMPSPLPPPLLQLPSPSSNQVPSLPRSPTPPLVEPDSPYSALTSRIFPDSFPSFIPFYFFSPSSHSPIHSSEEPLRSNSPASTRSSVEFINEVHISPLRPKYYYYDSSNP